MEPYLGEVRMMGFDFNPRYWEICDGRELSIADNKDLFGLLKTTYGGDGVSKFRVPDLRGAAAVHGIGQQIGPVPGERGGAPTHTLVWAEVPAPHNHEPQASSDPAGSPLPAGNVLATTTDKAYAAVDATKQVTLPAATVQPVGANQPHENMAPYLAVTFCIARVGIMPPRPAGGDS